MKKRFSALQQIAAGRTASSQGVPVGDLCRKVGISEQSSTGGRRSTAACNRARPASCTQLRDEVTRLKRLVADLSLDEVMLQDVRTHEEA